MSTQPWTGPPVQTPALKDRTHILPFEGATDTQFCIARSFALLNAWHAALNEQADLAEVLMLLVRQTSAFNICLYRFSGQRAHVLASANREGTPAPSRGSLAGFVTRQAQGPLRPGSIQQLSVIRKKHSASERAIEAEWGFKKNIWDVSLVILESEENRLDVFELTMDQPPSINPDVPPSLVTQALADAWSLRRPGFVATRIKRGGRPQSSDAQDEPELLGPDNPFALSPAEQKVCRHLAAGRRAKEIALALGVSVATVRTHLSRIYQKTGTEGQVSLLSRLAARAERL